MFKKCKIKIDQNSLYAVYSCLRLIVQVCNKNKFKIISHLFIVICI